MEYLTDFVIDLIDNKFINGWYIILFVSILYFLLHKIENINMNKKIGILNIIIFLLCFFNILSTKLVLLVYLITLFVYIFVLSPLTFKDSYLKHPLMFLLDYFYRLFVDYGFLYLFISLLICCDFIKNNFNDYILVILIISGYFLCRSVIECIDDKTFQAKDLDDIFNEIDNICKYQNFKYDNQFIDYTDMLISKEDKSFLERTHSYNWFCLQFVWYRIKLFFKYGTEFKIYNKRIIGKIAYIFITIYHSFDRLFQTIKAIITNIWRVLSYIGRSIFKNKKKPNILKVLFSRGYSTIEMQIIRTIALTEPQKKHYVKRKIYELIYSYIFFKCLKEYLNCKDDLKYKYYIINIYLEIAPVKVNDKYYDNIYKLYNKPLKEISREEFFIYTLCLSFIPIKGTILEFQSVEVFKLNKDNLKKVIDSLLNVG